MINFRLISLDGRTIEREAIRDLTPPSRIVLPTGEYNELDTFAILIVNNLGQDLEFKKKSESPSTLSFCALSNLSAKFHPIPFVNFLLIQLTSRETEKRYLGRLASALD